MIKITICDDERFYIDKILGIINKLDFEWQCNEYTDSKALLLDIGEEKTKADIYVLDIEMPNISGMELAKNIKDIDNKAIIIFITNYDKYVFTGYEVGAFRYVQKNKIDEKLADAVKQAAEQIKRNISGSFVVLDNDGLSYKIDCNSIICIEKYGKNVEIILENGTRIRKRIALSDILDKFNDSFILINRGTVINVNKINRIEGQRVIMDDMSEKYISRRKVSDVKGKIAKLWRYNAF